MNKLSIILFSVLLGSCDVGGYDYDKAKFKVSNISDNSIDSLIITNHFNDEINLKTVYKFDSGQMKNIKIDMTETTSDGSYTIKYKMNGEWYEEGFGYYTNGRQTEELISIKIMDADSLMIEDF